MQDLHVFIHGCSHCIFFHTKCIVDTRNAHHWLLGPAADVFGNEKETRPVGLGVFG